jgi:sporulation protein YlmC with PRC-barrel domain
MGTGEPRKSGTRIELGKEGRYHKTIGSVMDISIGWKGFGVIHVVVSQDWKAWIRQHKVRLPYRD